MLKNGLRHDINNITKPLRPLIKNLLIPHDLPPNRGRNRLNHSQDRSFLTNLILLVLFLKNSLKVSYSLIEQINELFVLDLLLTGNYYVGEGFA